MSKILQGNSCFILLNDWKNETNIAVHAFQAADGYIKIYGYITFWVTEQNIFFYKILGYRTYMKYRKYEGKPMKECFRPRSIY